MEFQGKTYGTTWCKDAHSVGFNKSTYILLDRHDVGKGCHCVAAVVTIGKNQSVFDGQTTTNRYLLRTNCV